MTGQETPEPKPKKRSKLLLGGILGGGIIGLIVIAMVLVAALLFLLLIAGIVFWQLGIFNIG